MSTQRAESSSKTDASPSNSPFTCDAWHGDYVCKCCGQVFETDEVWCAPAVDGKFECHGMRYCPICGYPAVKPVDIEEVKRSIRTKSPERRYAHGDIECIDAIKAALSPEEWRGFVKGNVLKYVWREAHKGGDCDLEKARDYLARYLKKGGEGGEPVEEG